MIQKYRGGNPIWDIKSDFQTRVGTPNWHLLDSQLRCESKMEPSVAKTGSQPTVLKGLRHPKLIPVKVA